MGAACPRCGGSLLFERDDATRGQVAACLMCGERLWLSGMPTDYAPPIRSGPRPRPEQVRGQIDGRRLLFEPAQVAAIQAALDAGVPVQRVARRFGCAYETIRRIKRGEYR
jgi:hypothetical protein